ncbi:MAG: type II and III secretion system protein [Akkermansiaceae bacterium]|jgi:general secretion pathway protein D|nr:type II and III secretion system protein [Akkermansiaceae bacterium]
MQKTPKHPYRTTAAALLALAAVTPVLTTAVHAQSGGYSSLAEREMLRRQGQVAESDRLRDEARQAYAEGKYKEAYDNYKQALQVLPNAPLLQDRRDFLNKSMADAAVELSKEYRRFGKYDEARRMLEEVIAEDPNAFAAKTELEYLDDPIGTNPALTEEHSKNIEKVRQGLYMAQGYYDLGQFDEAHTEYEKVLRIDKYNSAARRGMERVAQARRSYYKAAYDQTRAELLSQVDAAWELTVPPDAPLIDVSGGSPIQSSAGATYILQKLKNIVIPIIDFEDTSVEEAIDYLRVRSIELDTLELDPTKKGINFVIRKPQEAAAAEDGLDAGGGAAAAPGAARINELRLRNVPLAEALNYICEATRLRWSVDDFAVTIKPATEIGEDLFTRTFNVPPDFLNRISGGGDEGGGGGEIDPFAPDAGDGGGSALRPRMSIVEALKSNGVKFPGDASAQFFASNSTLLVRNTPSNLDLVEQIVNSTIGEAPKQVKISTKFVEITQENTDELGFDWIVTPFGLSANSVFLGGGTVGSGQSRTNADFISPVDGVTIPGVPAAPGTDVFNIIGAGNRTGDGAITRDSIAALLNNPGRASQAANAAPGIMALTGLFSDGQVQLIMRGLSQKKGTDLMTAPSVTARSGEKATIEIIREFIYPTEYEPPELPNSVGATGGIGGGIGLGGGASSFPVTPATPTSFETRNTGVTLEIAPNIGNNDFVIDLNFAPEIVEFEGFINYGSPIQSPSTDLLGNPTTVTITENRIEMPVFSKRSVNTALTIFDGYTVAVGGLMREDVQNVEDKVPILGDIPIVGRLFQSKAENRIKSNLIIFVTAEIIDATGRPLNQAASAPADPLAGGAAGSDLLPPLPPGP